MSLIVVGSINTDLVVRTPRLPRPGETVLGGSFYRAGGGKGANQAVAAARFGRAAASLVAAVGDDDFGRAALAALAEENLCCRHVKSVPGEASGIALILVDEQGENSISVASGANLHLSPADIDALPDELFASARVLLASLEVPLETVARALVRARSAGLKTVLNPAPASREVVQRGLLEYVDVLTPNQLEAELLTGVRVVDAASAQQAARELRPLGCGAAIVTLGAAGCAILDHEDGGSDAFLLPAMKVTAVDATAAGDAFSGVLAAALAEGHILTAAARFATAAAGLSVTRSGAQPSLPHRDEIEAALSRQLDS